MRAQKGSGRRSSERARVCTTPAHSLSLSLSSEGASERERESAGEEKRGSPRGSARHRVNYSSEVHARALTYNREPRVCLYLPRFYHMLRFDARGASQPGARAIRIDGISPLGSVSYAIASVRFTRPVCVPRCCRCCYCCCCCCYCCCCCCRCRCSCHPVVRSSASPRPDPRAPSIRSANSPRGCRAARSGGILATLSKMLEL